MVDDLTLSAASAPTPRCLVSLSAPMYQLLLMVSLPSIKHFEQVLVHWRGRLRTPSVVRRLKTFKQFAISVTVHEGSRGWTQSDAADMRLLSSQYFNQGVMNGYCRRHYQGFRQRSNSLIPVIVQVCCVGCGGAQLPVSPRAGRSKQPSPQDFI